MELLRPLTALLCLLPPLAWAEVNLLTFNGWIQFPASRDTASHSTADHALDAISVLDYGAKCDNATDDTTAFQAAFTAAASKQKPVSVPPGTCLTTGLSYTSNSYASQFGIRGAGRRLTRIKQIAKSASQPVLTIGSATATNYIGNIEIRGITFDANDKSQPAVVSYDLVRSFVWDVLFTRGSVGYLSYGGIGNTIFADATNNGIGAKFDKFASRAGGGWPNHIRWTGALSSNSLYGLWIDNGRNFVCDTCDIEGNGTTLGAASGGVYVGPNMGSEVGGATTSAAAALRNSWFEDNSGDADVILNSGRNLIDSCVFNSQANAVTYDIHIIGGNYTILNSRSQFTKTANIKDEAGVSAGNTVDGGYFAAPNLTRASWLRTFNAQVSSVLMTAGAGLQVTGGTFKAAVPSQFSVSPNLSAAGTTQATATSLTSDITVVTAVPSGSGVKLQLLVGQPQQVFNRGANALLVYPAANSTIDARGSNAAVSIPAEGHATFTYATSTKAYQAP